MCQILETSIIIIIIILLSKPDSNISQDGHFFPLGSTKESNKQQKEHYSLHTLTKPHTYFLNSDLPQIIVLCVGFSSLWDKDLN